MVELIAIPAVLVGIYALWIVGWPDFLRIVQGTRHVRARVVRHVSCTDGFTAIFAFQYGHQTCEVPDYTSHASPTPDIGSEAVLNYPAKRPDLARRPAPLARTLLYLGFVAWIGFFSDLWLNWIG